MDNDSDKGKKRPKTSSSDSSAQKTPQARGYNKKEKVKTRREAKEFLKDPEEPKQTASQPQKTRQGRQPDKKKRKKKSKSISPEKTKQSNNKANMKDTENDSEKIHETSESDDKSKQDHEEQDIQNTDDGYEGKKLSTEKMKNSTETPTTSKERNHIRDLSKEFAANKAELVQKQIPQYLNQTKPPTQTSTPIMLTTQPKKPSLVSQIVEKFGGKRNETTKDEQGLENIDDTINEDNETSKDLMKIIRSEEKDEEDEIVFRGTSTEDLNDTLGIYSPL